MNYKTTLLDEISLERAIKRISHEIIEKNHGLENVLLIGIKTRGISFAKRIQANLKQLENIDIPCECLDITLYRDDLSEISDFARINEDLINVSTQGKKIILCDDVLFTGRTVRAAIEAIIHHGRPQCIQLAIIIDRGHRELPIRADYVGKNVPTSKDEIISVKFEEVDGLNRVDLYSK